MESDSDAGIGRLVTPPDFTNHTYLHTLDAEALDMDAPHRRIIMVGDLHGMMHSFE